MTKSNAIKVVRGLLSEVQACALAIGNFDGVHLGHQALLRRLVEVAKARGLLPAVLTFEPHPREYFGDRSIRRISTLRDRYRAILSCGIERIYVMPFNEALASLTPERFAKEILVKGLDARWVTVGKNFFFGARGEGSTETLETLGKRLGFEVFPQTLLLEDGMTVSSSRVREAMLKGDLTTVEALLGRPYSITGRIVHGAKLGRTLGFPTLNIDILPPGSLATPALRGVFATRITGLEESTLSGVSSLGVKPTVTSDARWLLETHVFDWTGNAYGKMVTVEFVAKLRDEKRFNGLEQLKDAIANDARRAREILLSSPAN